MKSIFLVLMLGLAATHATAGPDGKSIADGYFSGKNLALTQQEKNAIAIAQRWRSASGTGIQPVPGKDGTIRFLFGAQQPGIVCAVLQVCDIELQAGEQVNSIHLGDTARWTVEPAITGSGPAEVQHLIIKPLDVGLETSLIVTTSRRTYHFRLRSHRSEFMPRIAFTYIEDAAAKWDALKTRDTREKQERTIAQTGEYLGDLSFAYVVTGSAPWKPVRVYNNGSKTIIQMPLAMAQTEAPTLLVVRRDGGLFSEDETAMVNYRLQGDRYIVDTVFDKAILIAGAGRAQDKVTITREK
ncbi:P-type conjugative transfer protein TrbG [Janthinobacterium sp. HLX7-2]|uniref:P-type conjugative transfer protein TrbG n=1 Tax=Janthinobacterium sp. HLX7-2 TaxID=1259331 RepID=UPI003F22BD6E